MSTVAHSVCVLWKKVIAFMELVVSKGVKVLLFNSEHIPHFFDVTACIKCLYYINGPSTNKVAST